MLDGTPAMKFVTFVRRSIAVISVALFAGASPSVCAKAYFAAEGEMVNTAEAIAIVEITRVEETTTKGEPFEFRQIAYAKVEQTLKGSLPESVKLLGDETFICARVHFAPGRQLVFLRRHGECFVGNNWHLSVRPIKDGQIEWFAGERALELSWQPLESVLLRIKNPPPNLRKR
jgi:hypothetical protein